MLSFKFIPGRCDYHSNIVARCSNSPFQNRVIITVLHIEREQKSVDASVGALTRASAESFNIIMTGLLRTVVTGRNTRPVARERADPLWPPFAGVYDVIFISREAREASSLRCTYARVNNGLSERLLIIWTEYMYVYVCYEGYVRIRANSRAAKILSCRYYREYLWYSVSNTRIYASETSPGKIYNVHRRGELSRVSLFFFLLGCR